ncbi:MAG: sensor histidine kinase, partial [Myxococcaceae bacterium]|nr:sensor histidine kinase [Myxococcaceae bacterium]
MTRPTRSENGKPAPTEASHDRLLDLLKETNEQLVLSALRAQEAAERAEAARLATAQSEARFRSLVTTSAAIVWRADAAGRVEVDAEGWRRFTGATVEAGAPAGGWLAALHPD